MEGYGSYCALVAEVSTAGSEIKLHKATVVVDIGSMINPNLVRQQIESSIVYGMSMAMYDEITLDKGRVQQTNFNNWRVVRIDESPAMDVHIIAEGGAPGGIGEPITAIVAPAVANAVAAATGKRLRSMPLKLA
jgi:isoquinoline 1-oxidoreductase beta subunit